MSLSNDQTALPQLFRFTDLKRRGIVDSWAQLRRMQREYGFPLGRMISPNIRTWEAGEIADWYASRPADLKIMPPTARRPRREAAAAA